MRYLLFIATLILSPIYGWSQTMAPCDYDTNKPIKLPLLYESDIMWSTRHWEEIDLKQKINHHLYYPLIKKDCGISLFDVIKIGLIESEEIIRAYADDRFQTPLTSKGIKEILTQTDTVATNVGVPINLNNPNTFYVDQKEIKSNDIVSYRIKVAWFFHKRTGDMSFRIMGIAPVIIKKVNGILQKNTLFWIYYDDARKTFAKHQAFDAGNLAYPMSYDEIFLNRYYNSIIIEEENVQDRSIEEQHPNNTYRQLYKGQRIKEKVRTFEGDMWDY